MLVVPKQIGWIFLLGLAVGDNDDNDNNDGDDDNDDDNVNDGDDSNEGTRNTKRLCAWNFFTGRFFDSSTASLLAIPLFNFGLS